MKPKNTGATVLAHHAYTLQAIALIELGARLQVVQTEVPLSRERLGRLYYEIRGKHAPKGMLPFSLDWFMSPLPNLHASMFYSAYAYLGAHREGAALDRLISAYRIYVHQTDVINAFSSKEVLHHPCSAKTHSACATATPRILSFTRAWLLVRFFDNRMLQLERCVLCRGAYIVHAHDLHPVYVCHGCRIPRRPAGATVPSTHTRDKH